MLLKFAYFAFGGRSSSSYLIFAYKSFWSYVFFVLVHKLMEMHESSGGTTTVDATGSVVVERPDNYEPPVLDSV